jgi:hypothetical protein
VDLVLLAVLGADPQRFALQPVVKGLGEGEEVGVAGNQMPLDVDSRIALKRNQRREQLGDPTTGCGRAELEHAGPAQVEAEIADRRDRFVADQAPVGLEPLALDVDRLRLGADWSVWHVMTIRAGPAAGGGVSSRARA